MRSKINLLIILLTAAGSAGAFSFRDYYEGNPEEDMLSHRAMVDNQVARRFLLIKYMALTSLDGLDEVPNIEDINDLILEGTGLRQADLEPICTLHKLRNLFINNNANLTAIPACIGKLTSLQSLHLQQNALRSVPETINNLSNLTSLRLDRNAITYLPEVFSFPKLAELNLSHNQINWTGTKRLCVGSALPSVEKIRNGEFGIDEFQKLTDGETLPNFSHAQVPIICDERGNNLLQILILGAQQKVQSVQKELHTAEENSQREPTELVHKLLIRGLTKKFEGINNLYLASFDTLRMCGERCIKEMLHAKNDDGKTAIDMIESFPKLEANDRLPNPPRNEFYDALQRVKTHLLSAEVEDERWKELAEAEAEALKERIAYEKQLLEDEENEEIANQYGLTLQEDNEDEYEIASPTEYEYESELE